MLINNAQNFGELIRTTRKASQVTQQQLAAASGTGIRFIRDLENGKPTCELEKSLMIAMMLGIKLNATLPLGTLSAHSKLNQN